MLKAGNTTFRGVTTGLTKLWSDAHPEPYALAEASELMGMRAWISHLYQEACDYTDPDGTAKRIWDTKRAQDGMDDAIKFIKYLDGRAGGRLTGFLFPYQTARCSDDLLQETMRQSKILGNAHVRSHFSQNILEYQSHKAKTNKTMVEWLQDIGFLGPQVSLIHAKYIAGHSATGAPAGDDLEILAETKTTVCHTPVSYTHLRAHET